MNREIETFDCVEMKRRIQEEIYEETKDMTNVGSKCCQILDFAVGVGVGLGDGVDIV